MSSKPKGKQGTKGQKQIYLENQDTLRFYQYIIFSVNIVFFVVTCVFFWSSFTTFYIILSLFMIGIYFGSYRFLLNMASAKHNFDGSLADSGTDLNMEGGISEHVKDIILLSAITQSLSLISNYFWLLLLLAPGRAFYMLWVNILGPWFFAPAPEENINDKKAKKQERKMKQKIIR